MNKFITVLVAGLLSLATPALAIEYKQPFSLTVSPYYLSLNVKPGGAVSDVIHLKNNSAESITLETGLMRFRSYNDQGVPELLPLEENDQFNSWISYSENRFTIGAGGSKDLKITISVPSDAALGYYYAITFKKASTQEGEETTKLLGSSAVLILLEVATPDIQKDVQIVSFTSDRIVYDYLPVTFRVTLKNRGNIHVAPGGNIFIDQANRKDIGIIDVNKAGGNILPDSTRVFLSTWEDGFPIRQEKTSDGNAIKDEKGDVVYSLKWNFENASHFRIGKYTANLLMIYDNGTSDVPITGTLSFWVVPWQMILAILAVLSLAIVGLLSLLKRFGWRRGKKKRRELFNDIYDY